MISWHARVTLPIRNVVVIHSGDDVHGRLTQNLILIHMKLAACSTRPCLIHHSAILRGWTRRRVSSSGWSSCCWGRRYRYHCKIRRQYSTSSPYGCSSVHDTSSGEISSMWWMPRNKGTVPRGTVCRSVSDDLGPPVEVHWVTVIGKALHHVVERRQVGGAESILPGAEGIIHSSGRRFATWLELQYPCCPEVLDQFFLKHRWNLVEIKHLL